MRLRKRVQELEAQLEERISVEQMWGPWPGPDGGRSRTVSPNSALQLATVFGCVKLITDSISTLPVGVYTKTGDTTKEITKPDWLASPTPDLDFEAWCTQVLSSLLLSGNAYLFVSRAGSTILGLTPIDPAKVRVDRVDGVKRFFINGVPTNREILHIPAWMMAGADVGVSPIDSARLTLGVGLAAAEYGSTFFEQGANMPGVVEIPGSPTPEVSRQIAQGMGKKLSKANTSGLPGVLIEGATWKATGITNEQAQFLETRGFTDAQIAGQIFLVDPSELGIGVAGTSLTYNNLQSRNVRLLQRTLLPWIVRLERALSGLLFQPRYVKFNVDGLLRGDPEQRWNTYEIAARINTASVAIGMDPVLATSEMRDYEELNPIVNYQAPPAPEVPPNAAA